MVGDAGVTEQPGAGLSKKDVVLGGSLTTELAEIRGKAFFGTEMEKLKGWLKADQYDAGMTRWLMDFGKSHGGSGGWDEFLMYLYGDGYRNASYMLNVNAKRRFEAAAALAVMQTEAEAVGGGKSVKDGVGMFYAVVKRIEGESLRNSQQRQELGKDFKTKLRPAGGGRFDLPLALYSTTADLELLSFLGKDNNVSYKNELGDNTAKTVSLLTGKDEPQVGLFDSNANRDLRQKLNVPTEEQVSPQRALYRELLQEIFGPRATPAS